MVISIVICTYNRPQLLYKCILSVLSQKTEFKYEVVVIDNDKYLTAKSIVEKFPNQLYYYVQPMLGFANVRNMAFDVSRGNFILFIDDDEVADENWLQNIVNTQNKYNADVVFGRVIYRIPENYPSYIKNSKYYMRKKIVTGRQLQMNEGYSGNTLILKDLMYKRSPVFDPKFNSYGGEDTDFFNFLISTNHKLIYCNEAIIYENQDFNRLSLNWYFKRAFNSGSRYINSIVRRNDMSRNSKFYRIFSNIIFSLMIIPAYLLLSIFYFDRYFLLFCVRIGSICGKIFALIGLLHNK